MQRRRTWLHGRWAAIIVSGALGAFPHAAAAHPAAAPVELHPSTYLALGDAIPFGYTEELATLNAPGDPATAFEGGYPNILARRLARQERTLGNALSLVNLSCTGESSNGLIGEDAALGGEASPAYEPCPYHNRLGFPLHYEHGASSQLEAAVELVEGPVPVKAVTIAVGSQDEVELLGRCSDADYVRERHLEGTLGCLFAEAPVAFERIAHNIGVAVAMLRGHGYEGPVAVLGFYNPQALIIPGSDFLQRQLNTTVAEAIASGAMGAGVAFADPFRSFNPHHGEGAAICTFTEVCNPFDIKINEAEGIKEGDIHPSARGSHRLASLTLQALRRLAP